MDEYEAEIFFNKKIITVYSQQKTRLHQLRDTYRIVTLLVIHNMHTWELTCKTISVIPNLKLTLVRLSIYLERLLVAHKYFESFGH